MIETKSSNLTTELKKKEMLSYIEQESRRTGSKNENSVINRAFGSDILTVRSMHSGRPS